MAPRVAIFGPIRCSRSRSSGGAGRRRPPARRRPGRLGRAHGGRARRAAGAVRVRGRRDPGALLGRCSTSCRASGAWSPTAAPSGCYVTDRRDGERRLDRQRAAAPPSRHELDDLVSVTLRRRAGRRVLVVCNPYPATRCRSSVYGKLVADVRANGTPVLVDLSSPRLDSALEGGPTWSSSTTGSSPSTSAARSTGRELRAARRAAARGRRRRGDRHARRRARRSCSTARRVGAGAARASSAGRARAAATR